jgi:hypothetical protein
MPCSYCRKTGHNKTTCIEKYKDDNNLKALDKRESPSTSKLKKIKKLERDLELYKERFDLSVKMCTNERYLRKKIEKANAELHQDYLNQSDAIHRCQGDLVMTRMKFKASMIIVDECCIKKNVSASPEPVPFDCCVCYETKYDGIVCSNDHKLCMSCTSKHLWHTTQSCPMCREIYHHKTSEEIANLAGMQLTTRVNTEGNTVNGVTINNLTAALFVVQ